MQLRHRWQSLDLAAPDSQALLFVDHSALRAECWRLEQGRDWDETLRAGNSRKHSFSIC